MLLLLNQVTILFYFIYRLFNFFFFFFGGGGVGGFQSISSTIRHIKYTVITTILSSIFWYKFYIIHNDYPFSLTKILIIKCVSAKGFQVRRDFLDIYKAFDNVWHEGILLNPFVPKALFLWPLETSGNVRFSDVFRGFLMFLSGRERVHWEQMG